MNSFWAAFATLNSDESDDLVAGARCFAVKESFQNCNVQEMVT
jgi:hypothetical protein